MSNPKQSSIERTISVLKLKARTIPELADAACLSQPSVKRILADLRADGAAHIESWTRPGRAFRQAAVYAYGPGRDAPRPPTQTKEERREKNRLYHARASDRKVQKAEAERLERIRRELARPAFRHWQDAVLFGEYQGAAA